jgi:hypothetical protein
MTLGKKELLFLKKKKQKDFCSSGAGDVTPAARKMDCFAALAMTMGGGWCGA